MRCYSYKKRGKKSCFKTKCGNIVILNNVVRKPQNQIFLIGHRFTKQEDYYNFPIASSEFGIIKVSHLSSHTTTYKITLFCKCILFPDNDEEFVCIPLLLCNNY